MQTLARYKVLVPICLTAFASVAATGALQQKGKLDEKAWVRKATMDRVTITHEALGGDAAAKVFSAPMFKVKLKLQQTPTQSQSLDYRIARVGDKAISIGTPSQTADMPDLVELVHKKFKITDDASAKVFEAALDAVFPIRFDKEVKAMQSTGKNS